MINLDLLKYQDQLVFKKEAGKRFVFDPIRKKHLVLTPEELVRQLLVCYLMEEKGISKHRIALEKALTINGILRRWDLLVYNHKTEPILLVECKAPKVKITQATFEQIARYNLNVQVPFLLVTNGVQTYFCQIDFQQQSFQFLEEIPNSDQLNLF